jgi:hypothetical protein
MKKHDEDHTSTKWNGPGETPSGVQDQVRDEEQKDRLVEMSMNALRETSAGNYRTWEDLAFLRKNWDGPLLVKGIQSAEDAERAVDAKMDGIIVSNHGGRQVGGAIPSLRALDLITRSKKVRDSGLTILFDSGIRTGAGMIKALARESICIRSSSANQADDALIGSGRSRCLHRSPIHVGARVGWTGRCRACDSWSLSRS